MEVKTMDSTKYHFYPVNIFRMSVSVKAAHDAYVSFTSGESDTTPMIEVIIGGWQNTKTAIRIRLENESVDVVAEDTPELLTTEEYRDFTLEWAQNGTLFQLYGGADREPFLSWENTQCPFPVTHFGVRTSHGATGEWICDGVNCMGTPDSLNYNYNLLEPVGGRLDLKVRARKEASICLASEPSENGQMHEIVLGGSENSKCSITHDADAAEFEIPGLLSSETYKGFRLEWNFKELKVYVESSPDAIMEWMPPIVHLVTHFGIRTTNGSEGSWIIPSQGVATVETGEITFGGNAEADRIRAEEEAERIRQEAEADRKRQDAAETEQREREAEARDRRHAEADRLRKEAEDERIRRNAAEAELKRLESAEAERIRRETEARNRRHAEADRLRQEAEAERLRRNAAEADRIRREADADKGQRDAEANRNRRHVEADRLRQEAEADRMRRYAAEADRNRQETEEDRMRRDAEANRNRRHAEADRVRKEAEAERLRRFGDKGVALVGDFSWVAGRGGSIPPGAVVGGQDGAESIYIARAHHERDLIPGKLVPSHGVAYVPHGGKEHAKMEFEVLVAGVGSFNWVASGGKSIPDNAIPGGYTEDRETLFIGRTSHCGTLTVGKIHPSHGTLYIPYGGLEIGFPIYEILVKK